MHRHAPSRCEPAVVVWLLDGAASEAGWPELLPAAVGGDDPSLAMAAAGCPRRMLMTKALVLFNRMASKNLSAHEYRHC